MRLLEIGFCIAALLAAGHTAAADAPVVATGAAVITGRWTAGTHTAAFLGVPFAEPPVGDLRWRAPVEKVLSGAIDATEYKPACMQTPYMVDWYRDIVGRFGGDPAAFPFPRFDEDCLYLNIWTPEPGTDAPLPVMVWIHGGNLRGGWSYEPNYVGDELARRGVVMVSIAYRVDVFGFFQHPDLDIADFGLLDQIAALRWVKDHIADFGGDPDRVTVFGESAGAASIGYLLAIPAARGLFQRAIHQSAGYEFVNEDTRAQFLDKGAAIGRRVLGDGGRAGIAALRNAPAQALMEAAENVYTGYRPDVVVDGVVLTRTVSSALDSGRLGAVDIVVGTNADEWLMYLDPDDRDVAGHAKELGLTMTPQLAAALDDGAGPLRTLDRLITGHEFVCPSLRLADYMRKRGKQAWAYYFTRVRPGPGGAAIGAYHGAELPYVFDTHDDWLPTTATDAALTEAMGNAWAGFAASGRPANAWPAFDAEHAATMFFGDTIASGPHPERALCEAMAGAQAR